MAQEEKKSEEAKEELRTKSKKIRTVAEAIEGVVYDLDATREELEAGLVVFFASNAHMRSPKPQEKKPEASISREQLAARVAEMRQGGAGGAVQP